MIITKMRDRTVVAWVSRGKDVYTIEGQWVLTADTPRLAKRAVADHNASL